MSRYWPSDEQEEALWEAINESLRDDREKILEMDEAISEAMFAPDFERMVTALADIGGRYGLLQKIGPLISNLPAGDLDKFAELCRLADMLAEKRADAIQKEAEFRFRRKS